MLRLPLSHCPTVIFMLSAQDWLLRLESDGMDRKALTSSSFDHVACRRFSRVVSGSCRCCAAGLRQRGARLVRQHQVVRYRLVACMGQRMPSVLTVPLHRACCLLQRLGAQQLTQDAPYSRMHGLVYAP